MRGHILRSNMNRRSRRQQRPARLRLQVAVCTLHVAFRECVARRAIQTHLPRRGSHAAFDNTRRSGKQQVLIRGSVASLLCPSLAISIDVRHVSLLDDRLKPTRGKKSGVERLAGADTVLLPWSLRHNPRLGRTVNRSNASGVIELRAELSSRNQRLLTVARGCRTNRNLRRS